MRVLQTISSNDGFRLPGRNPDRLAVLDGLLEDAAAERADLVVLPGGYLAADAADRVPAVIRDVARRAAAANVAVIGGVDVWSGARNAKSPGKSGRRPADLPYFGFAVGPVEPPVADARWRQTSSDRTTAAGVADADVPGAGRVVAVAGRRVGVLICGELFSRRSRQSFAGLGLDLALDLGHVGMGTGVTRAMENIARNGGCAVAHAQHVAPHSAASLHFVRSDGVRESVPLADCRWRGGDVFWVAWTVRDV